jgi:predicted nucleotidyltransferase
MRRKLLDISKKIDALDLEILKKIKVIADNLQIDFFIVGATVRDIILNYIYEIEIYRATNDIDFAVRVKSWDEYNLLVKEIEKKKFNKDERILHRYTYNGMIIDFIPFGDISSDDDTIIWPDKYNKEMNVIGFDDAYMNTEDILIQTDPDIIIKAASVESLVMLKIFAWNDRAINLRLRDAKDLYLIIDSYLRAGNEERLFEEHSDIVEKTEDYELSGARLLGRDISNVASNKVMKNILELLHGDKLDILANEMSQYEGIHLENADDKLDLCEKLLRSLLAGLEDEGSKS